MELSLSTYQINRYILLSSAVVLIALGTLILFAWHIQDAIFIRMGGSAVPMQPNSALCFVLSGISVLCTSLSYKKPAILAAFCVLLIVGMTIIEYIFGIELFVDKLLFPRYLSYPLEYPGRIAPNTSACFLLTSISLIIINIRLNRPIIYLSEALSGIAASISGIALFGHFLGIYNVIAWFSLAGMAVHTSVGLVLLSMSLFLSVSIFSFRTKKTFYATILGIILVTIYMAVALWKGFDNYQHSVSQRYAQYTAGLISYTLKNQVENLSKTLNRINARFEAFGGYNETLWQIDKSNYLKDIASITDLKWYSSDSTSQIKDLWRIDPQSQDTKQLFEEVITKNSISTFTLFFENQNLLFLLPLITEKKSTGSYLIAQINVEKFIDAAIPKYLLHNFTVEVTNGKTILYQSSNPTKKVNMESAVETINDFDLNWEIHVTPNQKSLILSYFPYLIFVSGFFFTLLTTCISYLFQHIFSVKEELATDQKLLNENLSTAGIIQKTFLPTRELIIPWLNFSTLWLPANKIGGDIFNVIKFDKDRAIIYLADVSGHDVSSALVTISISQFIQQKNILSTAPVSPKAMLTELEREFPLERFNRYFTIFYSILDNKNGTITYSSGGHPSAIILREEGNPKFLDAGGPLIGLKSSISFEEGVEKLHSGDKLFLYSDGIVELVNLDGEQYGNDRLYTVLNDNRHKKVDIILTELYTSIENYTQKSLTEIQNRDDISIMALEYQDAKYLSSSPEHPFSDLKGNKPAQRLADNSI